ncbi:hypothetical protein FN846DRAFT_904189 [Sphaerosporella brunnea]|uniref:Uncharacterized protein n=1 Tax=Sphaerosporella brunnea TaxID=1250544 RepID=A0A5J5F657_9PEZI|nr:hypothetical protein FN846DRAFT_904189 [Sphaerosporella brunnea]
MKFRSVPSSNHRKLFFRNRKMTQDALCTFGDVLQRLSMFTCQLYSFPAPEPSDVIRTLEEIEEWAGWQQENALPQVLEELSLLWTAAVKAVLTYGGRQYGMRRAAGVHLWKALAKLNSKLPVGIRTAYQVSPGNHPPLWMADGVEVRPEVLPQLFPHVEARNDAERIAFGILSSLIQNNVKPGAKVLLGYARFGYSMAVSIPVVAVRNITKEELGWRDKKAPALCVIENPGILSLGAVSDPSNEADLIVGRARSLINGSTGKYGLTCMHVTSAKPPMLAEQEIRYPGGLDILTYLLRSLDEYDGDPSQDNLETIKRNLQLWDCPRLAGMRLSSALGIAPSGWREDWSLISVASTCQMRPFSDHQRRGWSKPLLEQLREWGFQVKSVQIEGFRDPSPGERVFSDGCRHGLVCGVMDSNKTACYEKLTNGMIDKCWYITIWQDGMKPFGADEGDSGSAIFGIAEGGDGIEMVGMLINVWRDWWEHVPTPAFGSRCGLVIPATKLFDQLKAGTGMKWRPV